MRNRKKLEVECKNCQVMFFKIASEVKRIPNHFCSRSCAASFNGKKYPKRSVEGVCKKCNIPIHAAATYCVLCNPFVIDFTKLLYKDVVGKRIYQKNSAIRTWARRFYFSFDKPDYCAYCSYSKHIDICHIKQISSYSPDTPVSEINDIDNLIGLCKNHHWEFDHGMLTIEEICLARPAGFEPT